MRVGPSQVALVSLYKQPEGVCLLLLPPEDILKCLESRPLPDPQICWRLDVRLSSLQNCEQ